MGYPQLLGVSPVVTPVHLFVAATFCVLSLYCCSIHLLLPGRGHVHGAARDGQ